MLQAWSRGPGAPRGKTPNNKKVHTHALTSVRRGSQEPRHPRANHGGASAEQPWGPNGPLPGCALRTSGRLALSSGKRSF